MRVDACCRARRAAGGIDSLAERGRDVLCWYHGARPGVHPYAAGVYSSAGDVSGVSVRVDGPDQRARASAEGRLT